jgi:hypothetical protein
MRDTLSPEDRKIWDVQQAAFQRIVDALSPEDRVIWETEQDRLFGRRDGSRWRGQPADLSECPPPLPPPTEEEKRIMEKLAQERRAKGQRTMAEFQSEQIHGLIAGLKDAARWNALTDEERERESQARRAAQAAANQFTPEELAEDIATAQRLLAQFSAEAAAKEQP